jgi:hypothetical protein
MGVAMESYVLHIHRRTPANATPGKRRALDRCDLVGLLESVGDGQRLAFHSMEELWAMLLSANEMPPPNHR